MIVQIIKMYIRHYRDNEQTTFYVEYRDENNQFGRIEGRMPSQSSHMQALLFRGLDEGAPFFYETW